VLATDGLWDVMSSADVAAMVGRDSKVRDGVSRAAEGGGGDSKVRDGGLLDLCGCTPILGLDPLPSFSKGIRAQVGRRPRVVKVTEWRGCS
jgi:hypothetical protein